MANITKELAVKIAKKLNAVAIKSRSKAHDLFAVEYQSQVVAEISIRRGSRKDLGHDHVPRDLHVSPRNARLLAQCPLSREEYFQLLREQGLINLPE